MTPADLAALDVALAEWAEALAALAASGDAQRDEDGLRVVHEAPVVLAGRVRVGQEEP